MAYVYIYYDTRKNPAEPIYIGKGQGKRMSFHKTRAKNPALKGKIAKMKELGLEPLIEKVVDNITHEEALKLEMELIAKYGRIDLGTGTLCNLTEGGEGTIGRIPSESTKKLWSEQRKGKKQTPAQYEANCNRIISDETKEKQHKANLGKDFLSKEQREAIRLKNLGRTASEETKKLLSEQRKGKKQTPAQYEANCNRVYTNYKKVKCITTNKIYNNINEAADDLKLKTTAIAAVARGDRKTHKGHQFIYI